MLTYPEISKASWYIPVYPELLTYPKISWASWLITGYPELPDLTQDILSLPPSPEIFWVVYLFRDTLIFMTYHERLWLLTYAKISWSLTYLEISWAPWHPEIELLPDCFSSSSLPNFTLFCLISKPDFDSYLSFLVIPRYPEAFTYPEI